MVKFRCCEFCYRKNQCEGNPWYSDTCPKDRTKCNLCSKEAIENYNKEHSKNEEEA